MMSHKQPLPTGLQLTALDPVFRERPNEYLDRLRAEDPIHRDAELEPKAPAFRRKKENSGETQTLCWRERDSALRRLRMRESALTQRFSSAQTV
jgi:hypothetical protein